MDRNALKRVSTRLARIGPDHQKTYISENIGFCHCRLDTTWESSRDFQPLQFANRYLLVGDIRLDDREHLAQQLSVREDSTLTDAELVSMAWLKWNESLVDHLLGDFSFVVWDSAKQSLFGARDQLGVSTLYFNLQPARLEVGNCLNAMVMGPPGEEALDPESIGEFLLFGQQLDNTATPYRNIRQLAPAHYARFAAGRHHQQRYWHLPDSPKSRRQRSEVVIEQIGELIGKAVSDRFRHKRCDILTSGGLDSSTIAASAVRHAQQHRQSVILTTMLDQANPNESEHLMVAKLADKLGVETRVTVPEDGYFAHRGATENWPCADPSWMNTRFALGPSFAEMSESTNIAMTGQGGDAVFYKSESHFARLASSFRLDRLLTDTLAFYRLHGHRPSFGIRPGLQRRLVPKQQPGLPVWLNPDLLNRTDLEEKWMIFCQQQISPKTVHKGTRPEARAQLASGLWQKVFRLHSPDATGQPLSFRHPYFDLRLMRALVLLDQPEWFHRKKLLRELGRHTLPEAYIRRPKRVAPLAQGKTNTFIENAHRILDEAADNTTINEYVVIDRYDKILRFAGTLTPHETVQLNMPLLFLQWVTQHQGESTGKYQGANS